MTTPLTAPRITPPVVPKADPATVARIKAEKAQFDAAAKVTNKATVPAAKDYGISPINTQQIDPKGNERLPQPLVLVPMSGRYKSMSYKIGEWLGLAANEITQTYGANWEEVPSQKFVPNVTFKSLTQEKFSVTLAFHSATADVAHLTEGLKHLRQISAGTTTPPILLYKQGSMTCFVVLTNVSVKYSNPNGAVATQRVTEGLGFKYAESVSLDFIQVAGQSGEFSQTSWGGPLTSTPQETIQGRLNDSQRTELANDGAIDAAIGNCMPAASTAQIKQLLKDDRLNDPTALLGLDPTAFATLAIAQKIPKSLLDSNPAIQQKLKIDLAIFIAQQEDGIKRTPGAVSSAVITNGFAAPRAVANYYLADDATAPIALNGIEGSALQNQSISGRIAYQAILRAINSDLGLSKTAARDATLTSGETAKRLNTGAMNCALTLARADLGSVSGVQLTNDPATILKLSTFKDKHKALNDEDRKAVREAFNLNNDGDVRKLFKILPVTDRQAFELAVNTAFGRGGKISGTALWSRFAAYVEPAPTTPTTTPAPTPGV